MKRKLADILTMIECTLSREETIDLLKSQFQEMEAADLIDLDDGKFSVDTIKELWRVFSKCLLESDGSTEAAAAAAAAAAALTCIGIGKLGETINRLVEISKDLKEIDEKMT